MVVKVGYLLPTRDQILEGVPSAGPLLDLAQMAEALGFDSVWAGDSLTARPRHEPLSLLAAVAARVPRVEVGTAVLLPALRNPVLLAHQVATIDQVSEGRLVLGVGIAADAPPIRAEFQATGVPFEKRAGRMLEGLQLCRQLWTGNPVTWSGRWQLEEAVLSPVPHRPGGPPILAAGSVPAALARVGRHFDGWFPIGPNAEEIGRGWTDVQKAAETAGRDPSALSCTAYLTLSIDEDKARAEEKLHSFLGRYYGASGEVLASRQACYAGSPAELGAWLNSFVEAGASDLVLRLAGDHEHGLETIAQVRKLSGL